MAQDKVEVTCPKCATKLKFSAKFVGRIGMCVACGEQFQIKDQTPAADPPKKAANPPPDAVPKSTSKNFKISTYFKKPPKQS